MFAYLFSEYGWLPIGHRLTLSIYGAGKTASSAAPVLLVITIFMDSQEAHFRSIPWCGKLLNDPEIVIVPVSSRIHKEDTEDALFAETLNSDSTIRACLTFYQRAPPGLLQINEIYTLVSIGHGVDGHANVCHGGIVATLMDEVIGELIAVKKKMESSFTKDPTMTAYLNVTYLKPVTTPQVILVMAKLRGIKGRKYYVDSSITDSNGIVRAKAEALLISVAKIRAHL